MPHISKRLAQICESQTLALNSVMMRMKREGKDVVSLGAGEPDFDTPPHIKEAAIKAIQEGFTKYTPVDGLFELKEAISAWIKHEHGVHYSTEQIIVTCGAKHAVYQGILAVCDPEDEVLLPKPYWVSYPEQIKLAGAQIVEMTPGDASGLKITAQQLEKAITSKTRLLILNSPSNPSGIVYSREELAAIAQVIKRSGIYVLADEIYDKITFDDLPFASMTVFPEIRDQVIYVNGVSKTFAMTGWRIGFLAAHQEVATAVRNYQGHSTSNPTSISQKAALEGYRADKAFLAEMKNAFQQRRDYVHQRLNAMPDVHCELPQGAFYAFPNFSAYYHKSGGICSSMDLCSYLIEKYNVAMVPGIAFGMDDYSRLSFATSMQNLEKALDRIENGLADLRR
ncbi:MAG: pyridoxal phosphate-dependent aminotransferase [Calditrichaeota bacterium]|nr:MAG: pyridoxal phosphate-dependent aminotransferase [Calditrichota bacterium]